jgi:hypothetical protein
MYMYNIIDLIVSGIAVSPYIICVINVIITLFFGSRILLLLKQLFNFINKNDQTLTHKIPDSFSQISYNDIFVIKLLQKETLIILILALIIQILEPLKLDFSSTVQGIL